MWIFITLACRDPEPRPEPTAETVETGTPTLAVDPITDVTVTLGVDAPAAAHVFVTASRPVSVSLHATDGRHTLERSADAATQHDLHLVGLYADAGWTITGEVTDADGQVWPLPERTLHTAALLPAPNLTVRASDPARMAPGWTVLPISAAKDTGYLLALDAAGEVAWWYEVPEPRILETRLTPRGTLLMMWDYAEIREIDWDGNVLRSVTSALAGQDQTVPVDALKFHHELFEDADGNWVTLIGGVRVMQAFPTSYGDPDKRAPAVVLTEPIAAIDPNTGEIVGRWDPDLVLDPERIGYDSLLIAGGALDWNHTNAVADQGDAWLVSLRHQDALVSIAKSDGSLRWILGNPANWSPDWEALRLDAVGDLSWPYHQHGVKWDDGRVLLFDNGNNQASPWTMQVPTPPEQVSSRLVEYQVDAVAGTVAQTWSFDLVPRVYAHAMGDADWLANGDVLGCWAYSDFEGGVPMAELGRGTYDARVVEVTRDGEVVFDVELWAGPGDDPGAWHSYRAERIVPPE